MSGKLDLKREFKSYFTAPRGEWEEVTFPGFTYLMVDERGAPGGKDYSSALEVLYPAAYGTKFFCKNELGHDYAVPPLEGLWWADDMSAFTAGKREEWRWTMMLMLPESISGEHVASALEIQARKKQELDFSAIRMDSLEEGRCLQRLHIGPFADEAPVLAELHREIMPAQGLAFAGHHHEIYLSDPRRSAPEKLRTILRQPVR